MNQPHSDFINTHTRITRPELVPEIPLHLATQITPIWQATESWLEQANVAPPFWAFAWPGGQATARHILDHPEWVANKKVLDFACGCGIAAIAAAKCGAQYVQAVDIDPMAIAALRQNASLNDVQITGLAEDIVGSPCRWDLILCGDVCYEGPMTRHILPWLRQMAEHAVVIVADPGRNYLPECGMTAMAEYAVPTTTELEDRTQREVVLYRLHTSA